jgi:hypothetical protein
MLTESTVSIGGPVAQPVIATSSTKKGIILNRAAKIGIGLVIEFVIGVLLIFEAQLLASIRSFLSCDLQLIQYRAICLTFNRLMGISSLQRSQIPYTPSSISLSACLISLMTIFVPAAHMMRKISLCGIS